MGMVEDLRFTRVRRSFAQPHVDDVYVATAEELVRAAIVADLAPGTRVAIAVGSRRIAGYVEAVRAVVDHCWACQLEPVVVSAMGSHGGATAAGQRAILAANGIDEAGVRAPIDCTMEVVSLGCDELETPVWFSRSAADCAAVVAVNRVKRHTGFSGDFGSGLAKMLALGLGQREGAAAIHSAGQRHGLGQALRAAARLVLARVPVRGGLAIVENAAGEVARVAAVGASSMFAEESRLLELQAALAPSLGVAALDLLILDRIGKDIAGTGMDPWVVGRLMVSGEPEPRSPRIARIYARTLSERSHGNAHGVGLADFVHQHLAAAIDWDTTRTNAITAGAPQKSRLPLVMASDRDAIDGALRSAGVPAASKARIAWARDTGHLLELELTDVVLAESAGYGAPEIVSSARAIAFDAEGNISNPSF